MFKKIYTRKDGYRILSDVTEALNQKNIPESDYYIITINENENCSYYVKVKLRHVLFEMDKPIENGDKNYFEILIFSRNENTQNLFFVTAFNTCSDSIEELIVSIDKIADKCIEYELNKI